MTPISIDDLPVAVTNCFALSTTVTHLPLTNDGAREDGHGNQAPSSSPLLLSNAAADHRASCSLHRSKPIRESNTLRLVNWPQPSRRSQVKEASSSQLESGSIRIYRVLTDSSTNTPNIGADKASLGLGPALHIIHQPQNLTCNLSFSFSDFPHEGRDFYCKMKQNIYSSCAMETRFLADSDRPQYMEELEGVLSHICWQDGSQQLLRPLLQRILGDSVIGVQERL